MLVIDAELIANIFNWQRLMLRMLEGLRTKQGSKAVSSDNAEYYKIYKVLYSVRVCSSSCY